MMTALAPRFHPGDRVIVAGELSGYATYLGPIDDGHVWVQFPDRVEPTPVAVSFLTLADEIGGAS
jgi:hypothetical protein